MKKLITNDNMDIKFCCNNKIYYALVVLYLFLFSTTATAQAQITISGEIKAKNGVTLQGATVTLHPANSENILGYAICGAGGAYSISAAAKIDSVDIRAAFLGYGTQTRRIAARSQKINFTLNEEEIKIREIKVRSPKIRMSGDTLTYDARQFSRDKDRTLVDMLDRLPGVEVNKETGSIKYQGKSINRFYVENLNLMDGRYGEISKNLPSQDVKSVEIFENHQPIRALQDISYTDQAAMNIKLKDRAKGRWIGNGITAGVGLSPILWRAELSTMRFNSKNQTYITYKTNNTGLDITIYDMFAGIQLITNRANTNSFYSPFLSSPALSTQRSLFNRTHVASINHLHKTGSDSNIRFNIDYKNEEKQQENSTQTTYFLPSDSVFAYSEINRVRSHNNELRGNIIYTDNSKRRFLENRLSGEAQWQKITSSVLGADSVEQRLRLPSFSITDNFKMIIRTDKERTYQISSNNKFNVQPQYLTAQRASTPTNIYQRADIRTFASNNSLSFGHKIKKVNIQYRTGYNFNIDNYSTGTEEYRRTQHRIFISPNLFWKSTSEALQLSLAMPMAYINISGSQNINNFSGMVFEPNISLRYAITSFWEARLGGGFSSNFGSIYNIVSDVMKDYRTRYIFEGELPRSNTASALASINYKNPIKAFFMYFNISYSHGTSKNTNEQIINAGNIINKTVAGRNTSRGISANGNFSKIFDWQRCSAKIGWSISQSKSEMLRNSIITPYTGFNYAITPSISIETFFEQMLSYQFEYSASRSVIDGTKQPFMRNMRQEFSYYIPIGKKIGITIIGEHLRNQISASRHATMFLMDANVRLKATKRLELTLNCNNIFNVKEYSYSYYNDLRYTSYSYKLRPINIMLTANLKLR